MKRKFKILISIIIGLFVLTPIVVYAAFTFSTRYSTNIIVGKVENATLTSPTSNLAIEFTKPGDSVEYTYSLTNNDSKAYSYYYEIVLVDSNGNEISESSQILNMIYVYHDDVYYGVLSDLVIDGKALPTTSYLLPNVTRSSDFKFELHNGASGLTLAEATVYLRIDCILETTNIKKNIYVSSNEEFVKAVSDINRSKDKTIVLLNDITVTTALNITNTSAIDVCGNNLILSADITVSNSAVLTIKDDMNSGSITGNNNFILNDSTSFINPLIHITNLSITNYNEKLLISYVKEKIEGFKFIDSSISNDLVGTYSVYLNKLGFSISSTKTTIENGVIGVTSLQANEVLDVIIETNNYEELVELKIIGSADVSTIINNYLAHLRDFTESNSIQVSYDLFLPTRIEAINTTISWTSSDVTIMSNDGRLQEEAGNITLTATIKVHDDVYTLTYYVYAVQQDNLTKLQYLATQIENGVVDSNGTTIFSPLLFNEIEQSFPLPTTVDGEHYYTQWTDNKKLGLVELNYELESTYLYLTVDKEVIDYTGGKLISDKLLSTADITLSKVTYSKAARLKIIGRFDNDEIVETYIAINIDLPIDSLQTQVFKDVQTKLDSVNVLQNILNTRKTDGVLNESGNFTLPNMIDSVEITFSITDGETVYTLVADENGVMTVNLDLTKLELTDEAVYITCSIITYDEEGNKQYLPKKDLTFNVPGALTPTNFKSVDVETGDVTYPFDFNGNTNAKAIFYSLKVQALQADSQTKYDSEVLLKTVNNSDDLYNLKPYILMHDIEQTEVLKFENGDIDTVIDYYDLSVYQTLIKWATEKSSISPVPESIQPFLEQGLLWITSDGTSELSDEEITMITAYCERFPGFITYWSEAIDVLDNILSESEEAELLKLLITDKNFITIMEWIISKNTASLYEVFGIENDYYAKQDLADTLGLPYIVMDATNADEEGNASNVITNDEERVLMYYVQSKYFDLYPEFYEVWTTYISRKTNDSGLIRDVETSYMFNYVVSSSGGNHDLTCNDPTFIAILEWALYSYDKGNSDTNGSTLEDFLASNATNKVTVNLSSIFNSELSYKNDWLYAEIEFNGSVLQQRRGDEITANEWNVLVKYLSHYGIGSVKYNNETYVLSKIPFVTANQNFANSYSDLFTYHTVTAQILSSQSDSGVIINKAIIDLLIEAVNEAYENATEFKSLVEWAKSTEQEKLKSFTSLFANNTNPLTSVDEDRISDISSNISYDEYVVLKAYLSDIFFKNYTDELQKILIDYYLPLDLDMNPQKNSLNDAQYTEVLYTIDSQGEFKEIIEKIRYKCLNGIPTITDDCDNLDTISASELEALANTFMDKKGFVDTLQNMISTYKLELNENGVYEAISVTSADNEDFDRTLSDDDQTMLENGIKTILGTNTEATKELKYIFIPLETVDGDDVKMFYALRYFTNLVDLSFLGTSTTFLFDSSKTANQVFDVVANVTDSLEKITFNYTGLSNISLISTMTTLEFIDLRFNYSVSGKYDGIKDINPILTLQENKVIVNANPISYLSVFKTDLEFLYGEVVFAKIYNINNQAKLYYEQEGEEVLYEPGTLSNDQQRAINACALLHEIETIDGPYILLPTKVYLDTIGDDVVWSVVVTNSLVSFDNNRISVNTLGNTGEILVSATVTVGEASYTRYFNISIVYSVISSDSGETTQ